MNPYLTPYIRINLKWIKNLNLRAKTTKLLKENIGEMLHNIGFGNGILDMIPKVYARKEKIDELNFIKKTNKQLCASKNNQQSEETSE